MVPLVSDQTTSPRLLLGGPVLTAFKDDGMTAAVLHLRCQGAGAGRGRAARIPVTHGLQVPAYSWVSVKVVCSFVTELKPLMASIRSSSSRYWEGSHRVRLAVAARPPSGANPPLPTLRCGWSLRALNSREASRHTHR